MPPNVGGMAQPTLSRQAAPVCAACYAQNPDRAHVDYRAAIEGRLIDPSRPRGGHVDWVIICEKCLRDGLSLLPEQADPREADRTTIAALTAELEESRTYAATLEAALAARPAQREHVHPTVTPVPRDLTPPAVDGQPRPFAFENPTRPPKQPRRPRYGAKS